MINDRIQVLKVEVNLDAAYIPKHNGTEQTRSEFAMSKLVRSSRSPDEYMIFSNSFPWLMQFF